MTQLDVAPGLGLDADYVAGASLAILGKRGAGKTHTCRVLIEELFAAGVQTVTLDPMGVFWGLRSSATGNREGLPIPVFGGDHGDAPLEPTAGSLMADLVVNEGLSMVLDLSGFGSRTQERTFAAAFLDRLYRTNTDLVHLVIDEADLFAPQKPRRDDARLLVTMENIVRRGRNKGIGTSVASQRAAVLNKDILTQADALVAMRVAAPQDRDAIRDWVRGQGDEQEWMKVAASLPGLANGECWWWVPEKDVLQRTRVRETRTFDSSPTRSRGHSTRAPKTFADVDLAAISDQIAATIERAKASDPKELTARIRDLEKRLAAAEARAQTPTPAEPQVVEVPVVDGATIERLEGAVERLQKLQQETDRAAQALIRQAGETGAAATAVTEAVTAGRRTAPGEPPSHPMPESAVGEHRTRRPKPPSTRPAPEPRSIPQPPDTSDPSVVTPARHRLLVSLALLASVGVPHPTKIQLALWAGVSPRSGGFKNNLGALRTAGFIDYPAPAVVALTDAGAALAGPVEHAPTDAALHEMLRGLLTPARWRILEVLIDAYPAALLKTDLAEALGVPASSGAFKNNLGALRSQGLLDYPSPGEVAGTGVLFVSADE